jgi:hypothetical protein
MNEVSPAVDRRVREGLERICGGAGRARELSRSMTRDATRAQHSRAVERAQAPQASFWFDRMLDEMIPTQAEQHMWLDRSLALWAADGGDLGVISRASPRLAREIERSGGLATASRRPSTTTPAGERPAWWINPSPPPDTRSQREPYAAEMRREAPTSDSPAVRIKHDAYCLMGDAVFGQSVEVGGGLFGWSARKPGGGITVVEANLACSDVTANGLNLDFDQLLAVSDGWTHNGGAVRLIGDWHSHPDRSATPSRKDVKAWVAAFDMVAAEHRSVSHYFGLIVGPAGRDDAGNWQHTKLSAWAVSRDKHGRAICERARVERA